MSLKKRSIEEKNFTMCIKKLYNVYKKTLHDIDIVSCIVYSIVTV